MSAPGFTKDFAFFLATNARIVRVKLQPNNWIAQSFGPLLEDDGGESDLEVHIEPNNDFESDRMMILRGIGIRRCC